MNLGSSRSSPCHILLIVSFLRHLFNARMHCQSRNLSTYFKTSKLIIFQNFFGNSLRRCLQYLKRGLRWSLSSLRSLLASLAFPMAPITKKIVRIFFQFREKISVLIFHFKGKLRMQSFVNIGQGVPTATTSVRTNRQTQFDDLFIGLRT